MRRFRTRTTAWPAVADLMTVLAVVGLVCTVFLGQENRRLTEIIEVTNPPDPGPDSPVDTLKIRIDSLPKELNGSNAKGERQEAIIDSLNATVDSLEAELATREGGFEACWPTRGIPRGFYYTYHVQVQDDWFSFTMHEDWAPGTEFRSTITPAFVQVLEEIPQNLDGGAVRTFGERIDGAREQWTNYPLECRFAVTINRNADGVAVGILTSAGFYPVYR